MSPTPSEHHFVETDTGVVVHVLLVGSRTAEPPLVVLHGNRDNHSHFSELVPALVADRQVALVDFRGHGLSSPLRVPATPELFAADVSAVIQALDLGPVVLVGHSLGSVVSMVFATTWPDAVSAVVLLGTAATFELSFRRPEIELTPASFPRFLAEANARATPLFFHPDHPEVAQRVRSVWSTTSLETHLNLVRLHHPDLRALVPRLPGRLLVIAGADDRCTPVDKGRWIVEHHPHASLAVIAGCAHFMYMEDPAAVVQSVQCFLAAPSRELSSETTHARVVTCPPPVSSFS